MSFFPDRLFPPRYFAPRYFTHELGDDWPRQVFVWRSTNSVATGTVYNSLVSGRAWTATESQATTPWCVDGFFESLHVRLASAPGSGKSVTFTVRKNGADTALTVTISGTATDASFNGAASRIAIADGDTISLKAVGSGTPTVSISDVVVEFVTPTASRTGYAIAPVGGSGSSANRWTTLLNTADGWGFIGQFSSVNAVAGSITKLRLILGTAPGSGKSISYRIMKNGVAQDGTGGTPETVVTISDLNTTGVATFTLSTSPEDTLALLQAGGSGSPSSGEVRAAILFQPTTSGEFTFSGETSDFLGPTATTVYNVPVGYDATNATESNRAVRSAYDPGLQFKALYTVSSNIIGGTNGVQVTLRVAGADTALTVAHSGTAHNITTDVDAVDDADLSIKFLGNGGSGFSRTLMYGLRVISRAAAPPSISGTIAVTDAPSTAALVGYQPIQGTIAASDTPSTAALVGYQPIVGAIGAVAPAADADLGGYTGYPTEGTLDAVSGPSRVLILGGLPVEGEIGATAPASTASIFGGAAIGAVIAAVAPAVQALLTSGEVQAVIGATAPSSLAALVGYVDAGIEAVIGVSVPRSRAKLIAEVPVERLTLTINGVDFGEWWHQPEGWDIAKEGSQERMTFYIADKFKGPDAVRVYKNDVVLLKHPVGGLIFGGFVNEVTYSRVDSEVGTLSEVTANDWMFLADQVFLPMQTFAEQDWYELFASLVEQYLEPKGWTNIGPPTSDGELLAPRTIIDTPITTLRAFFDRMLDYTNAPVRVNGELEAAVVEQDSIIWPGGTVDGSNALLAPDVTATSQAIKNANRLTMKTATPPQGASKDPYYHEETIIANGVKTVFLLNTFPTKTKGALDGAVVAGVTTLNLKGLPVGGRLRWGNKFFIGSDPREYMVTNDATVDTEGKVTITCETVELDAQDGADIIFDPPAFMVLRVGGTDTPFAGAPWVYEPIEKAFVNPQAAPAAGLAITRGMWITPPTWVRAWETADPVPLLPVGWFNYSILVDLQMEDEEIYELEAAVQHLRNKLTERYTTKQQIAFTTYEHGLYPYLAFDANFPDTLIVGRYYVESVNIRRNGIDPRLTDNDLEYEVIARKDVFGRSSWDYYRAGERIKIGGVPAIIPTNFQWSANPEFVAPELSSLTFSLTPDWTWSAYQDLISSAETDIIVTAIIIEQTDADQPYESWARDFEIEVAVGAPGSEVAITKLKGHSREDNYDTQGGVMRLMIPPDACPAGSRLSMRVRKSPGGWLSTDGPWKFSAQFMKKPLTGNLQTTSYVQQHTSEGATIPTCSSPGGGTWSDWLEIISTTPYDAYLTALILNTVGFSTMADGQVQIGVAEVGEEPIEDGVIADISDSSQQAALSSSGYFPFENPIFVNGSQSVWMRIKSTDAADVGLGLHYVRAEE